MDENKDAPAEGAADRDIAALKGSSLSKEVQVKIRLRRDLYDTLEEKAALDRRPMNKEIVARLEESIRREDVSGGSHTAVLFNLLAAEIGLVELRTGRSWHDDRKTLLEVVDAVVAAMSRLMTGFSAADSAEEFQRLKGQAEKRLDEFSRLRRDVGTN